MGEDEQEVPPFYRIFCYKAFSVPTYTTFEINKKYIWYIVAAELKACY